MEHVKDALDRTDWKLLSRQKRALLDMLVEHEMSERVRELLDGLLNWIDAMQDAAETDGYPVEFIEE